MTLQQSLRDTDKITFLRGVRQIRQLSAAPVPAEALQALGQIEGSHAAHLVNAGAGIALVMSGDLEQPEFDTYDEGRLSERIMLAAAADGLDSAIGFADAEGHRQRTRPAQPRKPLSEVVHSERFS